MYSMTPEQVNIQTMIIRYKTESGKSWAIISREAKVTEGQLRQIREGKSISSLSIWEKVKDYAQNKKIPIKLRDFCAGEKTLDPNNPFDKEKLDERKLKFIAQFEDDFKMCGVWLRDFKYNPDNKLFFVKDGCCRVTIDQMCRAVQDKYYKLQLEKDIQFRK